MKKSGKFPHRPSLRIDSLVYNRPVLLQAHKAMQSEHTHHYCIQWALSTQTYPCSSNLQGYLFSELFIRLFRQAQVVQATNILTGPRYTSYQLVTIKM